MDQKVVGLTQEVSDKPAADEEGVWQTTQLDSAIGEVSRGVNVDKREGRDVSADVATSDVAVTTTTRRVSRKKRRPKHPRVIPAIRVYIGTFVHATVDHPLVILERWMIGVDAGKVCRSV